MTIERTVVNHRARRHGTSNYGISRTIRVVLDLLTVKFLFSYSTRPLHIFGLLGFVMGLLGAAMSAGSRTSACSATSRSATGRCCCSAILLVFTGVQLVTLGLLAEMQARTYHESQNKPIYVIREIRETLSAAGVEVEVVAWHADSLPPSWPARCPVC